MKRHLSSAALAAALLMSGVSFDALLAPACAQDAGQVDFDTFHDQLAPYGDWVYSDRWGEVWIPEDVPADFRPYDTDGYWAYTDDYGWTWVSNYEWGDIPFHYGRWVNDPDDGWLWIPGYVWSPGWVTWRSNGQDTGWMPMPPDPEFLGQAQPAVGIAFGNGGFHVGIDFGDTSNYYGYSQWYGPSYGADRFAANWVFVGTGHLGDRDFRHWEEPRQNYVTYIHNTTNITHYTVVNNYIVNRSVDVHAVERAGGHPVAVVHLAQVMKHPQFVTRADVGQKVQARMRSEMPRGTGHANSAPQPSTKVVQSLSTKVPTRAGHAPMHVYTRSTVTSAPLAPKPLTHAAPSGGTTEPGGGMATPTHEHVMHMPPAPGAATTVPATPTEHEHHAAPTGGMGTAPSGATAPAHEHPATPSAMPSGTSTSGTPSEHPHHVVPAETGPSEMSHAPSKSGTPGAGTEHMAPAHPATETKPAATKPDEHKGEKPSKDEKHKPDEPH